MVIHFQDKDVTINKNYIIGGISILIFIFLLLILTPKDKSLECSTVEASQLINSEITYKATFKSNKLHKLIISTKNNLSDNYIHMLDEIYVTYEDALKNLKNNGGYDYELKKGNDFVSFKSTIMLNEIPDSTKEAIHFNENWIYEDFKKDLETVGFKCK